MKRKEVKKLLITQTKRRSAIISFSFAIILIVLLSSTFFAIYKVKSAAQYVPYNESSLVDYKVNLKENEFFENPYLENNQQYISNLIDTITANFNYQINIDNKEIEYKYKYSIEAELEVKEKNTQNILYNKTEVLLEEQEHNTNNLNVNIKENIDINYAKYNDYIKKFISTYKLDSAESNLRVNMRVSVAGDCEDYSENVSKATTLSVIIPLTQNTISIDVSDNIINTSNNVLQCSTLKEEDKVYLILGIFFLILAVLLLAYILRYIIKTQSAETIYEKELKKILNNYGTYIQMLGNDFYFRDYHMLKVNSFEDMLEIRDTIRQPILMRENNEKTGAYFIIPSSTKLLYIYRLKVSDIEKEIQYQIEKINKKELE